MEGSLYVKKIYVPFNVSVFAGLRVHSIVLGLRKRSGKDAGRPGASGVGQFIPVGAWHCHALTSIAGLASSV